ncbi:hypothetical protein BKA62DRAFT_507159 [Auriculariales sp. MPI-PUGE-AT-0066]|nr:hypothetical protein BKA62DRAFT_507159 [Auriculariales sp. MPI-PUGE-AT-0066]
MDLGSLSLTAIAASDHEHQPSHCAFPIGPLKQDIRFPSTNALARHRSKSHRREVMQMHLFLRVMRARESLRTQTSLASICSAISGGFVIGLYPKTEIDQEARFADAIYELHREGSSGILGNSFASSNYGPSPSVVWTFWLCAVSLLSSLTALVLANFVGWWLDTIDTETRLSHPQKDTPASTNISHRLLFSIFAPAVPLLIMISFLVLIGGTSACLWVPNPRAAAGIAVSLTLVMILCAVLVLLRVCKEQPTTMDEYEGDDDDPLDDLERGEQPVATRAQALRYRNGGRQLGGGDTNMLPAPFIVRFPQPALMGHWEGVAHQVFHLIGALAPASLVSEVLAFKILRARTSYRIQHMVTLASEREIGLQPVVVDIRQPMGAFEALILDAFTVALSIVVLTIWFRRSFMSQRHQAIRYLQVHRLQVSVSTLANWLGVTCEKLLATLARQVHMLRLRVYIPVALNPSTTHETWSAKELHAGTTSLEPQLNRSIPASLPWFGVLANPFSPILSIATLIKPSDQSFACPAGVLAPVTLDGSAPSSLPFTSNSMFSDAGTPVSASRNISRTVFDEDASVQAGGTTSRGFICSRSASPSRSIAVDAMELNFTKATNSGSRTTVVPTMRRPVSGKGKQAVRGVVAGSRSNRPAAAARMSARRVPTLPATINSLNQTTSAATTGHSNPGGSFILGEVVDELEGDIRSVETLGQVTQTNDLQHTPTPALTELALSIYLRKAEDHPPVKSSAGSVSSARVPPTHSPEFGQTTSRPPPSQQYQQRLQTSVLESHLSRPLTKTADLESSDESSADTDEDSWMSGESFEQHDESADASGTETGQFAEEEDQRIPTGGKMFVPSNRTQRVGLLTKQFQSDLARRDLARQSMEPLLANKMSQLTSAVAVERKRDMHQRAHAEPYHRPPDLTKLLRTGHQSRVRSTDVQAASDLENDSEDEIPASKTEVVTSVWLAPEHPVMAPPIDVSDAPTSSPTKYPSAAITIQARFDHTQLPHSPPTTSPRTTRRNMMASEMSESLRHSLLRERQIAGIKRGAGVHSCSTSTSQLPITNERGQPLSPRELASRQAIIRNRSIQGQSMPGGI